MLSPYLLGNRIRGAQGIGSLQARSLQRRRARGYSYFPIKPSVSQTMFTAGTIYLFRERLKSFFKILIDTPESTLLKKASKPLSNRLNYLSMAFLGIPLMGFIYAFSSGAAKGEEKKLIQEGENTINQTIWPTRAEGIDFTNLIPELQKKITQFEAQLKQKGDIDKATTDLGDELKSANIDTLRAEAYQLHSQAPSTIFQVKSPSKIYAYKIMEALKNNSLNLQKSRNELLIAKQNLAQQGNKIPIDDTLESKSKKWYCDYQIDLIDKELAKRGPAPKVLTKLQEGKLLTSKQLWKDSEPFRQPPGSNLCYLYSFLRSLKEQPGGTEFLERLHIREATSEGKMGYVITYPHLDYEKEDLKFFVSQEDMKRQTDSEKKESLGLQIIRLTYLKHPQCPGVGATGFATDAMKTLFGETKEIIQSNVPARVKGSNYEESDPTIQVAKLTKFIQQCLNKANQQVLTLSATPVSGGHYYSIFWDNRGQLFLGDSLDSTGKKTPIKIDDLINRYVVEGGVFSTRSTPAP
jgi:hypothetical protein